MKILGGADEIPDDAEVARVLHPLDHVLGDEARRARGSGGRDKTGDLARLDASLDQAMGLVREMEAAEASALDVGQSAQTTAAGLSRRISSIRSIKTSIHSMALNAHLKCVRLGEAGQIGRAHV